LVVGGIFVEIVEVERIGGGFDIDYEGLVVVGGYAVEVATIGDGFAIYGIVIGGDSEREFDGRFAIG